MPVGESLQEEDWKRKTKTTTATAMRNAICGARKVIHRTKEAKDAQFPDQISPKINLNDCLKGSSDHEKAFRRLEEIATLQHQRHPKERRWKVVANRRCRPSAAAVATRPLTLVTGEAVVEVLARGGLAPLRVGLLATAIAASAGRTAVAHGLGTIAGRRLGLGTGVARLLTRTVRTYGGVNYRVRSSSLAGIRTTTVLVKIGGGRTGVTRGLRALRAVLLVGVELLGMAGRLVLAPLRYWLAS